MILDSVMSIYWSKYLYLSFSFNLHFVCDSELGCLFVRVGFYFTLFFVINVFENE